MISDRLLAPSETVARGGETNPRPVDTSFPAFLAPFPKISRKFLDSIPPEEAGGTAKLYDGPKEVLEAARKEIKCGEESMGRKRNASLNPEPGFRRQEHGKGFSDVNIPTSKPSVESYEKTVLKTIQLAEFCKKEIQNASTKMKNIPKEQILSKKVQLCIELLHRFTTLLAEDCPKSTEIFKTITEYIYPAPEAHASFETLRKEFVTNWAPSKAELLEGNTISDVPEIMDTKLTREPFALLATKFKAYIKALKERLSWIKTKTNTIHAKHRYRVIHNAVQRWKTRTLFTLFHWWRNTVRHNISRRKAFVRFVAEKKSDRDLSKKALIFYLWMCYTAKTKFRRAQTGLLHMVEERSSLLHKQADVRLELQARYKHSKVVSRNKSLEVEEEQQLRAKTESRQQQSILENSEAAEPAVTLSSLVSLVVAGLKRMKSVLENFTILQYQDPLAILNQPPYNINCQPLRMLRKPIPPRLESMPAEEQKSKKRRKRNKKKIGRSRTSTSIGARRSGSPRNLRSSTSIEDRDDKADRISKRLLKIALRDNLNTLASFEQYSTQVQHLESRRNENMKEAKDIFERISEKKLALLWVNHHISRSARKTRQGQDFDKKELKKRRDSMLAKSSKLNKTRIKEEEKSVQGERNTTNTHVWNFTTDFQDCEVLGRLLQVIVPHAANKRLIESADLLQRTTRIKEVLNAIGRLRTRRDSEFGRKKSEKESKVGLGDFIKAEDLINGQSGDKICILCLRLLADYPGMEVDTKQLRRGIEVEINKWMALIHELVDQRIMVVEKMNRLRDLNEKVISSFFSISMLIDDLRLRHKFWVEVLQPRAQKASLAFLARLARGENIKTEGDCLGNDRMEDDTKHFRKAMGDSRHVEPVLALQSFLSVSTANVMHYPEHERKSTISRQMLETQEVLKKHYTELRRVYKYFAQQDQSEIKNAAAATCMNITEFWSLVKDCGLLKLFKLREQDKKSRMRSSLLVKLFRHIAQACSEELKGPGGLAPTPKPTVSFDRMKSDISPEEIHSDLVLNLKSFLRLLIALVIQCAGGRIHQLAFYLDKFITLKILPSCKFIDNRSFRTHLQNLEVFQLFHKHRKYLLRVFYTYSISKSVGYDLKDSVRHEIWKETMDFEEFYEMCENSLIVDEKLCQRQLYYIFTSAQEEEASLKTCPSLTYPEFLDTLSAIAIYKRPLPFDTMLTRVDQFLRLDFVPWIRRTLVM